MKTRREFIADMLLASLILGGSCISGGCSTSSREGFVSRENKEHVDVQLLGPQGLTILHNASLAPSGHNSQPWRVRICKQNEWIIEADPTRRLPCVDPDNRELLLSLGAFLENLLITAATFGLHTEVDIMAKNCYDREIVRLVFQEGPLRQYRLQTLKDRRTVKHGQLPRCLASPDLTRLMATTQEQVMYAARGSKQAAFIADAAVEAFRLQSHREDAQREFVSWLRLDRTEVMRHRDGITTESMGINGVAGWYVNTFLSPSDFLTAAMRQKSIDATAALAREGGGWLLLTSRGQTVAELLACGRRFQQLSLAACELGIAIHPMSQILEEEGASSLKEVLGDDSHTPQFVLRVGYLDRYPAAAGLRRPVTWFIYS